MAFEDIQTTVFNEREVTFQFVLLEKSMRFVASQLEHEKATRIGLQAQVNELKKENREQTELLRSQRQQVKEWAVKIKQFEKNEISLKEKIQNLKEYSIIVKNPKSAEAIAGLKEKIDDYIRYVEEAITLLHSI